MIRSPCSSSAFWTRDNALPYFSFAFPACNLVVWLVRCGCWDHWWCGTGTDVAACLLALPCFLFCCAVCACPCPIAVHADCWSRAGLDHTPLFSVIPFFPTGFLMVDCHASFFCISVLYAMRNKHNDNNIIYPLSSFLVGSRSFWECAWKWIHSLWKWLHQPF